jgi:hypothetical protein
MSLRPESRIFLEYMSRRNNINNNFISNSDNSPLGIIDIVNNMLDMGDIEDEMVRIAEERSREESYPSKSVIPEETKIKFYKMSNQLEIPDKSLGNCECPICLEKCVLGQFIGITKCKHIFHKDCIVKWTNHGDNCPVCRILL